jgi:DNA anti-recombination protein RmuC
MKKESTELQKIKGIGEVLSERLIEAGYDTFDKIVAAGEAGLKKIRGLDRLPTIKPIIDQAASFVRESHQKKTKRLNDLKAAATAMSGRVEGLARTVKDRFGDRLTEKVSGKIEKQLLKMTSVINKVKGGRLGCPLKPAAKRLAKVEKRLAGMTDAVVEPAEFIMELKKARRALKKILCR